MSEGPTCVKADEAVEPLDDGYSIIQPKDGTGYRFGGDAIALARFVCDHLPRGARVLDLCSGCGVIGTVLNIERGMRSIGVELDARLYDMSVRSARDNRIDKDVGFVHADVCGFGGAENVKKYGKFDAVVCNPPFFKADSKPCAVAPSANSELTVSFFDIVKTAKAFLDNGGAFFIVHTATRLDEVLAVCRENKLMPKTLIVNQNGKTFLLRCVLGAKSGLIVTAEKFKCFTS